MKLYWNASFLYALSVLLVSSLNAQDLSGSWQGVNYAPGSSTSEYWPSLLTIVQTGTTLTGECLEVAAGKPQYFVLWEVTNGIVQNNVGSFELKIIKQQNKEPGIYWCLGSMSFIYYPNEEKIIGTETYSNCGFKGNFELYRIALKSSNKFCRGQTINLVVTGKDVRWYTDKDKKNLVNKGNSYSPTLTNNTTFYITQTYYGTETPPVPFTIEVSEAQITAITSTPASCNKNNGAISVMGTGIGQLVYSINDNLLQPASSFTGLQAGTYKILIQDSQGCKATKATTISQQDAPKIVNIEVINPTCSQTNGKVKVLASGGTSPLTYSLDGASFQTSNVFSGLKSADYVIKIRDSTNCEVTKQIKLIEESTMKITRLDVQDARCDSLNGSILIVASGGTSPLTYSVDGQTFQMTGSFMALKAGQYAVKVKDANGCVVGRDTILKQHASPRIEAIKKSNSSCGLANGKISIEAVGSSPLFYSINNTGYIVSSTFQDLGNGIFEIRVKDSWQCQASQSITIDTDCRNNVFIPTSFSPNHDTYNDFLDLKFPFTSLKIKGFVVFSRWGEVVYHTQTELVVKSGAMLWDGRYKGQILSPGQYTYELIVEFITGETHTYRNAITIIE